MKFRKYSENTTGKSEPGPNVPQRMEVKMKTLIHDYSNNYLV